MNALVRKELRLLLPALVAALAAATLPVWSGRDFQGLATPCFGLAALFLGLTPFGQEMSWGTFGLLLSQPEKRQRFWRLKAGLLALALLSAWGLFALCWWIGSRHQDRWFVINFGTFADNAGEAGLLALLAFSGGLWSTLLLRDVTTAFFAAVLAPLTIFGALILCLGGFQGGGVIISFVLGVYAVAGFFAARRLFLGAEDVAWTGGQISLASARGQPFRWLAFGFQEKRGPWSALIHKELQLQELTVILVPLLAVLHLTALAVRHFHPEGPARARVLDFAAYLWMVAPFVVGCVAVAEERRYNTLESFLCLPVRKRSQFALKFAVVMALGTLLGGVFPWVLESIAGGKSLWTGPEPLMDLVLVAAGIAAVSFFASTMSRGMLQAFTVGLLFPILLWLAAGILLPIFSLGTYVLSFGGWLFPALAWPAMLLAYFWLAFRNYKLLQTGWPLWTGNFTRLAAVFLSALLVASAIYARAWEYAMPLEPRHGPARLSGAGRAMLADSQSDACLYALLPDGRLWAVKRDQARPDRAPKNLFAHVIGGSNWVDLAGSFSEGAVALKSDGTLWRFSRKAGPSQIGSDSDWKKVVAGQSWFLALKQNGTIWGWGIDEFGTLPVQLYPNGRPIAFNDPVQLWPEADWVDIFASGQTRAVKRDGSIWSWGYDGKPVNGRITNYSVYHRLVRMDLQGTNWSSLAGDGWLTMGVRTDGTLWAGAEPQANARSVFIIFGSPVRRGITWELGRIGTKSDWVEVSRGVYQFIALEADGTFWAISRGMFQTGCPSQYHDWLAASADGFEIWALAKDGTISCWRDPFQVFSDHYGGPFNEDHSHFFLLRPSRRPLASINILDAK